MVKRVTVVKDLLIHSLGNELVILNLNNEKYYTLNDMGCRMWELLTGGFTIEETTKVLMSEYDVKEEVLHKDLENLIQNLLALALIVVNDD